ncbi:SDR family NAD(P)-dependent oxidoreductase [Burkholderia cenocepacia]|uniref:SDR family oxidoreductase n=1 Tax=Burkholderia sola TaxID=2843302 RepID=A0ABV2C692_9BURK|nr:MULTISPECIES: SDR family oxidoreductase [unclassified Burkholderia]RQU81566.1 SDR family NAD(P)-dependent oxidoreductase [Burkholderia cenocepacia]MBP0606698.1 SDR family oxidoreductase [Burkholderia sp. CpTa8-5]MBP0712014.1 SDR family oxidoreductase [Burkholderia sp. AcTa6-5]RQU95617.1 SDR family NAD(P)-dependent oxidoreductase [Burkholderia cenocepacia]RQV25198.1 SDR family NAD(P)-dependent oxidoreductase [Burkholderia cenocepacia]
MTASDLLKPYDGLRVLVTGGASGIGLEIADAFAECGARVHVCDASQAAIAALADRPPHAAAGAISATLADVSDPAAVERVFADVSTRLGGLDVLVNNAGIAGPTGGIDEIDPVQWEQTVAINLNAQFQFARRAVPLLRESKHGGAIIALSSVAGRLGYAFRTPYAATKWAVVGLVKSLAIELGPLGIRVNAIQPGIVRGPRMRRVIDARAQQLGIGYDEMEKRYLEKISLRRMTDPSEIAATALFLCSPGGHGITGQAISVCGNVEVL